MFVCPKCGYRELPCWRAHRYFLYVVYCRIDELEPFKPDLCTKLKLEKDVEEGPYTYHLTSSGYVLRVPTLLKAFLYKRNLIQRYVAAKHSDQKELPSFL